MSVRCEQGLTSLSCGDDIVASEDGWDGVGLNWSRVLIAAEDHVLNHGWVKTSMLEL